MKVSDVVFREDLYPRVETSAVTVQKYAEDLDVLPPIEVNQHGELIDGWHRWTAHKKAGREDIKAVVVETKSDSNLLELAIRANAAHGLQLSQADKRRMAVKIYSSTPIPDRDAKKKSLAELLSVSDRTVREWTSGADKAAKEDRDRMIFSMWLSCYTQDEIAAAVGVSQQALLQVLADLPNLVKLSRPQQLDAEHAVDFTPPIYNIWTKAAKTPGVNHFGNSEVLWVDNLLYLYTNPFDVVIDPFAGGGSTIDICKKRLRRYLVSDRKPIVEREKEIRKHDILEGPLKPPQWKDVKLVYLDPPYWAQARNQYSDDPEDLANQSIEAFTANLSGLITAYAKKLSNAHIALIIQPTQWNAPEKQFTDHVADMMRLVKLPVEMRYSVPYSTEQCNAQMVDWAKASKRCLVLTREIIVWRV